MIRVNRVWPMIVLFLAALGFPMWSPSQLSAQSRDERAVRAAYVFNLTRYVDWPPETKEVVIGFWGNRNTAAVFQRMLDGRSIGSKIIRLVPIQQDKDSVGCNIIYFEDGPEKHASSMIDGSAGRNVLTIGETASFTRDGGMIALINVDEQIQIEVNLDVAQQAGIHISSRLLSLAHIVHPAAKARD